MTKAIFTVFAALVLWAATLSGVQAQAPLTFRISTENTPTHVHTKVVQRFADALARRTVGRMNVVYQHSARLFRDRDVVKALNDGKVEMAVPGMWQLDRFEPNIGLFMLPSFYGRTRADHYRVRDGAVGQTVNGMLEDTIGVKVLGRWIDLGYAHLYFTGKKVTTHDDIEGMRIRVAGGEANKARIAGFGGNAVIIPWPDFPAALEAGKVSGVLTTHETVASAELWQKGIDQCFEDREYFAQYIPIVADGFWRRLPADLRNTIQRTWNDVVDQARIDAAAAQAAARSRLQKNGVTITEPDPEELARWRARLLEGQPELARTMGISETLLSDAMAAMP